MNRLSDYPVEKGCDSFSAMWVLSDLFNLIGADDEREVTHDETKHHITRTRTLKGNRTVTVRFDEWMDVESYNRWIYDGTAKHLCSELSVITSEDALGKTILTFNAWVRKATMGWEPELRFSVHRSVIDPGRDECEAEILPVFFALARSTKPPLAPSPIATVSKQDVRWIRVE